MKKELLVCLGFTCLFNLSAIAGQPQFSWGKIIDGDNGDTPSAIAKANDGDMFLATSFVSKGTSEGSNLEVRYDGTVVGTGSPNTSVSGNRNLLIQRINPDGTPEWSAYSYMGDLGSTLLQETQDGGVVAVMKYRHTNKNEDGSNRFFSFYDAKGNKSDIIHDYPAWIYQGVIMKLSSEGELEWTKLIKFDHPTINGKIITDVFSISSMTTDNEGNIYIGGNLRSTMTLTSSTGENVEITAQYTDGWDGDSQKSVGCLYIVKMDANGNYLQHFKTSGTAVREQVYGLKFDNGKLYAAAIEKGTGTDNVEFGGTTFIPTKFDDLTVFCMDTQLNMQWVKNLYATAFTDGKHTTQIKGLDIVDNNILITGLVKGGFAETADAEPFISTTVSALNGYVVRLSAENGELMQGNIHGGGISGYFNAYYEKGNTYAYGYSWQNQQGIVLVEFPAKDEPVVHSLIKGTSPTSWSGLFDNTSLYINARGRGTFNIQNSEESYSITDWGCLYATFDLSELIQGTSSVESHFTNNSSILITGTKGAVEVTVTQPTLVSVYNLSGQKVAEQLVAEKTHIALPAGFYIVNGTKVIVR